MPFGPPGFHGPTATSSLVALGDAVSSYFEAVGETAEVYLGLKHRDRWDTSRVVIIDGEFDGSNTPKVRSAGKFGPPTQKNSYNPRELVAWDRPVTLSIRAVDPTDPDSEALQIQATEKLIETTVQALQHAMATDSTGANIGIGQANIDWADSKALWCDPGSATQQTWGKEFIVGFTYRCVLFDLADYVTDPTPNLQKGPLLNTLMSGINARIASASTGASTAVVTGLGFCTPGMVGMTLELGGAASAGNNGSFPIAAVLSVSSLVIANEDAVAPDANNGAITWSVQPPL